MLSFDLANDPPPLSDIEAEKATLLLRKSRFKRNVFLCSASILVASLIITGWFWQTGLLDSKSAIAAAGAAAVVGAVVGAVAVAGAGAVIVSIAVMATVVVSAVVIDPAIVVVLVAVVVSVVVSTVVTFVGLFTGDWVETKFNNFDDEISQLEFLTDASGRNKHRCEPVVKACEEDLSCRAYATKTSAQGRSLTVAEANMIEEWVASADSRKQAQEKERVQEIACAKIKNFHLIASSED